MYESFAKNVFQNIFISLLLLFLQFNGFFCYNRSLLEKEFPGFGTKWIPLYNDDGMITVGYFEFPYKNVEFTLTSSPEEATKFTLYTRKNPKEGIKLTEKNLKQLDLKKPFKFVTHGWLSSGDKDSCQEIKNAYLDHYDVNVIIFDWGAIADTIFYPIPLAYTASVGDNYGNFLMKMIDHGVDSRNIHLIGYSIGGHISGLAARKIKKFGGIGRVTALDPAGFGFEIFKWDDNSTLQNNDANFVDVIHTCGDGFLGYEAPLGDVDFYPNGGGTPQSEYGGELPQPGCDGYEVIFDGCSHSKSWKYFKESITSKEPFMARKCNSTKFMNGKNCKGETIIPMGEPTPDTARGIFYLETVPDPPYVKRNV